MRIRWFALIMAAASLALAAPSFAQNYPNRPITLIVPFAPGGPADLLGRLVGQKISEDLGQQVVIDNRSGANTIVGAQFVARAQPDGYTVLLAIDGTLVMNPFLYAKLAYDPFKDFDPVSLIAAVPSAVTANIKTPVETLKDIIDAEKAKPGTFQIGVSTPTSQVAIGLLNSLAGINLTMVPYRGGTTQITSLLAGDIPLGHESVNVALPLYRDKKIKIIALTGQKRLGLVPEIPLIAETFPGFDLGIWQSVVAPAGTPKEIVDKLNAKCVEIAKTEDMQARMKAISAALPIQTPAEVVAYRDGDSARNAELIKAANVKLE
jgi:tripartite-type tricarboxylate transporter receptor subunit TctC